MANDWFVCEACGAERGCECHAKATRKSVRDAIVTALKENPAASNNSVAKQVSCSDHTVEAVRRALVANSQIANKPDRTEASGRKARGRKPGKRSGSKPRNKDVTDVQREAIGRAVLDEGKTLEEAVAPYGVSVQVGKTAVENVKGQRKAADSVDPATLSMSAREKLDAAIRQHKRELDVEFETRVLAEIQKRLREIVLPSWEEKIEHAEQVLKARRYGVFSREEYRMILSCLHPDSRGSVSDKRLRDAFEAFKAKERVLVENEGPNLKVVRSS